MEEQPEWWNFGPLASVMAARWDGNPWCTQALLLRFFDGGPALVEAVDDDTVRLTVPATSGMPEFDPDLKVVEVDVSDEEPWSRAIGASVLWGRMMVNHHGWLDGYQFEFGDADPSVGIELVGEASTLRTGVTTYLPRSVTRGAP